MRTTRLSPIVLTVILLLTGIPAIADTFKGKIIDSRTSEPLPGVSVIVKNSTSHSSVTGQDGEFRIEADDSDAVLICSFLGYLTAEVPLQPGFMTIEMDEDRFSLEEVVVTGQAASIQKRRISTNISTINREQIEDLPDGRLDKMLQSALPNVQINLSNGQPGTTSIIKSRGISSAFSNSTPVIYVDGIRVDNMNTAPALNNTLDGATAASGSIGDIPMENIERIEFVAGGAATTLYGSDAANGVIQIFTKKGGNGSFRGSFESQLGADIADSRYYYFDRTADLLHKPGFYQKYRLSFDAGNEKFGYSLGAGMQHSTGTLIHDVNQDKKYDLRFGSRLKINDYVEYNNSFGLTLHEYNRSRNGNQGYYTGLWFTEGAAATNFTYTDPNGNKVNYPADIDNLDSYTYNTMKEFVSKAEQLQNNKESVKRFQTSHSVNLSPLPDLTFKGTVGLDFRFNTNKEIITNEYLIHTQVMPQGTSDAGSINNFSRNYLGITAEFNGQHRYRHNELFSIISTAGVQFFSTYDHQSVFNGTNIRDGAQIITGAGSFTSDEWLSYLYNYGFYIQENIGFKDRLFIDLGLRTDYNTAFGENTGWQFYPKAGLSYVAGKTRIFANYGIAGSYPPAFEYQKTISIDSFLGEQAAGFGKYGNPNLGPEKKHSYEAGVNTVLFNNRLNVGVSYYYALTKDAIFSVPSLPSSGQAATYLANVGLIENYGLEMFAGVQILQTKDWNIMFNASLNTNHNTVLSTGGTVPFSIGGFSSRTVQTVVQEGKPVGFIRGSKAVLNPDGSLKEVLELQDLGTTIPTLYGNFSLSVSYRQLSFSLNGDYQAGSYIHSFDRQFRFAKGLPEERIPEKALEGSTPAQQWLNFTNFFVEKADFLKIRNISLSYRIPVKKYIREIVLGMDIYNAISFTASSVDPEAVISGAKSQGAVTTGGLNYSSYSAPVQYIGSVKITF